MLSDTLFHCLRKLLDDLQHYNEFYDGFEDQKEDLIIIIQLLTYHTRRLDIIPEKMDTVTKEDCMELAKKYFDQVTDPDREEPWSP